MRITSAIKKNSFLPINHIALNSFTICENSIIDLINDLDEKEYDLNAVTRVFIFLIRYLKGNSGTVALVGDFSIKSILQKLKWGANAKSRFKKCLNALEKIGFLIQTVVNNNTIYLNINQSSTEKNKNTIGGKTMHVVGGQTMSGVGGHPPHPCNIYNKEEINNNITSSLYSEKEEEILTVENNISVENVARLKEADELLALYSKAFATNKYKGRIHQRMASNFKNKYIESPDKKESLVESIRRLSENPFSHARAKSPDFIFYADIELNTDLMKQKILNAKKMIDAISDRKELQTVVENSDLDFQLFCKFFNL